MDEKMNGNTFEDTNVTENVNESPVEETTVEPTPVEPTPVESTPMSETPVNQTPVDGVPVGSTPNVGMHFCPNCGAQIEAGAGFCPACGSKLDAQMDTSSNDAIAQFNQSVTQQNDSKKKKKTAIIAGAAIAGAALIIAIIVMFFANKITIDGKYVKMGEDNDTYTFDADTNKYEYDGDSEYREDEEGKYSVDEKEGTIRLTPDDGDTDTLQTDGTYIYCIPYSGTAKAEVTDQSFSSSSETTIKGVGVTLSIEYEFNNDGSYTETLSIDYDTYLVDDYSKDTNGTYTVDEDTGLLKMTEDDGDIYYAMIRDNKFYKSVYEKKD